MAEKKKPKKPKADGEAPKRGAGGKGGSWRFRLLLAVILLLLYVFSMLPVTALVGRMSAGRGRDAVSGVCGVVYWPVQQLCIRVTPIGNVCRWVADRCGIR